MLEVGQILDNKYEILELIGEGGMSRVYLCKNTRLDSLCAVKEIKNELQDSYEFKCEVDILKGLNHPGIPRIFDFFQENGSYYIIEDYVEGKTLREIIEKRSPIKKETLYDTLNKLCDILIYLHSFNPPIIYRDLKPSNIMITPKGEVKLIDFGIARIYKPDKDKDTVFLGSLGYIAPELYNGSQSNILTDIYCLGATIKALKELTKGRDENLQRVVNKCMEIDSNKRYKSVKELKKDLIVEKTVLMPVSKKKKYFWSTKTIISLCIFVSLACVVVALSLKFTKDNKETKPKTVNNVKAKGSEETKPEEVKTVIKDYFIDGIINKQKSDSSSRTDVLEQVWDLLPFYDRIYELEPKAEAVIANKSVDFSISKVEFKNGQMFLYCQVENDGNSVVSIGDKDKFTIFDDGGNGIEGNLQNSNEGTISVNAGESNEDIIIIFKNVTLKSKNYIFKTNASVDGEDDAHYIRLKIINN